MRTRLLSFGSLHVTWLAEEGSWRRGGDFVEGHAGQGRTAALPYRARAVDGGGGPRVRGPLRRFSGEEVKKDIRDISVERGGPS